MGRCAGPSWRHSTGFCGRRRCRPATRLHAGDLLAAFDDRDLVLERLRWVTERQVHAGEYDEALSAGKRADAVRLESQLAQADAQIHLADEQLARTRLTAPFDGLLVSGDMSQSIGAPVRRGDVLFELAPLDGYRVDLEVGENQVADVVPGQEGHLVLASLPDETLAFHRRPRHTDRGREGRGDDLPCRGPPGRQPGPAAPGDGGRGQDRCRAGAGGLDLVAIVPALAAPDHLVLVLLMAQVFDQTWYRVADLRPRLRLHAEMHRHRVRGMLWYVLQDHQTGKHFRISVAAHALLCLMDGRNSMAEIMARLARRMGAERPEPGGGGAPAGAAAQVRPADGAAAARHDGAGPAGGAAGCGADAERRPQPARDPVAGVGTPTGS